MYLNFREYLFAHPSLLIITITYTIIFIVLIYKCVHSKKKSEDLSEDNMTELLELPTAIREHEYENVGFGSSRNPDRVSEALSTDEFEFFDRVSHHPLGQTSRAKPDPLYANLQ